MSRKRIHPKQVQLYMEARETGCAQTTAAAKAGISDRSGRRIEKGQHQQKSQRPHDWRTREDPLAGVWQSELVPMLERQPKLQATTLFEYLDEHYPEQYPQSILRTLQRRVRQWKAMAGDAKAVVFDLEHVPGEMGFSDFTHFKQVTITIANQPFEHLLYHYRLACSGRRYVQVIQGGESFVALSEGLQNALAACGGSPKIHRTDSLSAAYRNLGKRTHQDLTQLYEGLCQHYRLQPTRNNRGVAHENGSIEGSHGHFKNRLHQALLLRDSFNFDSVEQYQQVIQKVVDSLNRGCHERFVAELPHLQPLPSYRYPDYEVLSVKVTTRSAITVRCITYTVPSRLIGHCLTVHLYHDRLDAFLNTEPVVSLPRIYVPKDSLKRRAHSVNYRHVIDTLRFKPRAFLHCTWQQDLLPNEEYRQLWQQMQTQLDSYSAARVMTESLYIAAKQDKEYAVAQYLTRQLQAHTLTLVNLQKHFQMPSHTPPILETEQHPLTNYDTLLSYDTDHPTADPQLIAQVSQTVPHAPAMV